ncbi:ABC transporter substrate-binding protein [Pseudonocardia sp. MH-G8]|uniref:ABC transporter substrate-binding protein n=1 Tax=Pseudonocardia sp. MH-G8 TaxID=1854588 RepID=UPI000B9FEEEC|nr:ABC transporter substrate-binding protein [Pseudonocardia sp. MH-G8]OZM76128.1 ABC transporter substrate-binding protein [Pseudonocardia sp. MH-G8]
MTRPALQALVAALTAVVVAACAAPAAVPPAAPPGCPPAAPAAPVQLRHATNVTLQDAGDYRVLTVAQPYPGGAPESTVLLPCGEPAPALPAELAGAPVVEVPVRSVYAASTTQLPMLADIGALDVLTGVGTPDFVSGPEARARIATGAVTGFATGGQVDVERVAAAAPDVLLSQGTDDPSFPTLRRAGVPVLGWADYLESGPLAQAEWIKVMGALTGREAEAERVFAAIEARYGELAALAAGAPPVPVLYGQLYEGGWRVPTGGSTSGALLRDAGGTWSEAGNPAAGGIPKDFESLYVADGSAPVWIADGGWATLADVTAADPRYGALAAVRDGQVWNRDRRIGPTGGNEVHERGITHPDELLADLVAVLHPDLLPDHELVYLRRVT